MVENQQERPEYIGKILWNNSRYDAHLKTVMSIGPDNFHYELKGAPSEMDLRSVAEFVSSIKTIHSLDDRVTQGIVTSLNELLENALKHSYKFQDKDISGKLNEITLGLSVYNTHIQGYCLTYPNPINRAPANLEKISQKLSQKVSREHIEENDALKPEAGGRGFMMTKLLSDMIYINQDSVETEFGFKKLLPN